MKISQISMVNPNPYSKNCTTKRQRQVSFQGNFADKFAETIVNGATLAGAGILYAVSKLLPGSNDDDKKEGQGRDIYDENLDVWHMGDATM